MLTLGRVAAHTAMWILVFVWVGHVPDLLTWRSAFFIVAIGAAGALSDILHQRSMIRSIARGLKRDDV